MSAFCVFGVSRKRDAYLEQISGTYDAPQFCQEWIHMARKYGVFHGMKIMSRSKCNGDQRFTDWEEYE